MRYFINSFGIRGSVSHSLPHTFSESEFSQQLLSVCQEYHWCTIQYFTQAQLLELKAEPTDLQDRFCWSFQTLLHPFLRPALPSEEDILNDELHHNFLWPLKENKHQSPSSFLPVRPFGILEDLSLLLFCFVFSCTSALVLWLTLLDFRLRLTGHSVLVCVSLESL